MVSYTTTSFLFFKAAGIYVVRLLLKGEKARLRGLSGCVS